MASTTDTSIHQPTPSELQEIEQLHRGGRFLKAWQRASDFSDPKHWDRVDARLLSARLHGTLGANRLGNVLHIVNHRAHRDEPSTFLYYAFALSSRFGRLHVLKRLASFLEHPALQDPERSDLLAFQGWMYGQFRDFDRADKILDEALRANPENAWAVVQQADLLSDQDRYEESLEKGYEAHAMRPWYRPAIDSISERLYLLNRDEEAMALLKEALGYNQSWRLAHRLHLFHSDRDEIDEALALIDEIERRSPLASEQHGEMIAGRRSDFHFIKGRQEKFEKHVGGAGDGFFKKLSERVEKYGWDAGQRIRLAVPFVRQHFRTCAPATMAALASFFEAEAEHLEMADEICYDGTPSHSQRRWAREHGMIAREFRVDWDVTKALIDRGVPFAVATVHPTSAHLQAIIGYDPRARSVIVRDPTIRHYGEWFIEGFTEDHAASGPRGMVMIPEGQAHLLDGIEFPDVEFFDLYHDLHAALHSHDREAAGKAWEGMKALDEEHLLTLMTERSLASYDDDPSRVLAAVDKLAKLHPDDGGFLLSRINSMRNLHSREESLRVIKEGIEAKSAALTELYRLYAQSLEDDARHQDEAFLYFRKAHYYRPTDADMLVGMAGILWTRLEREEALELYRLAACLEQRLEYYSRTYFNAARALGRTDEAMASLKQRWEDFGAQNPWPAITYSNCLDELDQTEDSLRILDEAVELRPEDGTLLLHAAGTAHRWSHREKAQQLLERARGKCPAADWERKAARFAAVDLENERALAHWESVLSIEPMAVDAHQAKARLLAEQEGPPAAIAYLAEACEAFPHSVPLQESRVRWLRSEDSDQSEEALRKLRAMNPESAWAVRELALELLDQSRFEEAAAEIEHAIEIAPSASATWSIKGSVETQQRKLDEAGVSYRKALELSVDNDAALNGLVDIAQEESGRREALQFVEQQMAKQVLYGDALFGYQRKAFPILEPEELLASLQKAKEARPDLWQSWSAVGDQLSLMGQHDQAKASATEMTERFPLLPRSWFDLADVCESAGDNEAHRAALEKTLELSPGWTLAIRKLGEAHEKSDQFEAAEEAYRKAIREDPLQAINFGFLANLLWKKGTKEEAIETIAKAVSLDSNYGWAWAKYSDWSAKLGREEELITRARELAESRPGDTAGWEMLADLLSGLDRHEEAIEIAEKGIKVHPENIELHECRMRCLSELERFDEAFGALDPDQWKGKVPRELLGRKAAILYDQGHHQRAIEEMESIVETEPDYYWATNCLVNWHFQAGRPRKALPFAEQLIRLAPEDPRPYGQAARSKSEMGDEEGAIELLKRAYEIDPEYGFAGDRLFTHYLEEGYHDEARKIQQRFARHLGGVDPVVMALQLACRTKDRDEAEARLREICMIESEATWPLEHSHHEFTKAGWAEQPKKKEMASLYEELLQQGDTQSEGLGIVYVRELTANLGYPAMADRLASLDQKAPHVDEAWIELINRIGGEEWQDDEKAKVLRKILKKHRQRLRTPDQLWGMVGYVYVTTGQYSKASEWFGDWRDRKELKPWLLFNLAMSIYVAGKDGPAGARTVHEAALEVHPSDHTTDPHLCGLAFVSVLQGDSDEAAAIQKRNPRRDCGAWEDFLDRLTEGLVAAHELGASGRQSVTASVRSALSQNSGWHTEKSSVAAYRAAKKVASNKMGKFAAFRAFLPLSWDRARNLRWVRNGMWVALVIVAIAIRALFDS